MEEARFAGGFERWGKDLVLSRWAWEAVEAELKG